MKKRLITVAVTLVAATFLACGGGNGGPVCHHPTCKFKTESPSR